MDLRRPLVTAVLLCLLASMPADAIDLLGTERRRAAREEAAQQQHRDNILETLRVQDRVFEAANQAGLAIVIAPVFNSGNQANGQLREYRDYTTSVGWEQAGSNGDTHLLLGNSVTQKAGIRLDTAQGSFWINVVVPGTYQLQSVMHEEHYASTEQMPLTRGRSSGGIGVYELNQTRFIEAEPEQYWRPPAYETVNYDQCSSTFVVSGACASWVTWSEQRQTGSGGWATRLTGVEREGLIVVSKPDRALASLQVAPGQVVLMDNVFSRLPNNGYLRDSCSRTGGQLVECRLASFSFQVLPAPVPVLAQLESAMREAGRVELAALLARAQPVPLQITGALADWRDGQWGQNYYLEAAQAGSGR